MRAAVSAERDGVVERAGTGSADNAMTNYARVGFIAGDPRR
ncbi:hypothetical protein ABT369_47020 [Dactylosporangium sp. NPDC000244]